MGELVTRCLWQCDVPKPPEMGSLYLVFPGSLFVRPAKSIGSAEVEAGH